MKWSDNFSTIDIENNLKLAYEITKMGNKMDYKQHEQGYKDFYTGIAFNADESYSWQEGWHAGHWEHYLENSNIRDDE